MRNLATFVLATALWGLFPLGLPARAQSPAADALEQRPNVLHLRGNFRWTFGGYSFEANELCYDAARRAVRLSGDVQVTESNGGVMRSVGYWLERRLVDAFGRSVAADGVKVGLARIIEQPDPSAFPCGVIPGPT